MSWILAAAGGVLIAGSAGWMWMMHGRIAGISGITGQLLSAPREDRSWRWLFLAGLLVGALFVRILAPSAFGTSHASLPLMIIAGMLVGLGTTLANGCTSGHGVCGIGRLSGRSVVATVTFMLVAMFTVFFRRHV